jgi:GDP-L-fucose synthase
MPTNLYGTNDNYDLNSSHVLPALIRKFITAKKENSNNVEIWGSGNVKREFLHVDDLADACYFLLLKYNNSGIINVGWGQDMTIKELAELISEIIQFKGELIFNTKMPDGTPRKLMDVTKITNLGWTAKINLRDGISNTIKEIENIY